MQDGASRFVLGLKLILAHFAEHFRKGEQLMPVIVIRLCTKRPSFA
jgi:hypothetical protein